MSIANIIELNEYPIHVGEIYIGIDESINTYESTIQDTTLTNGNRLFYRATFSWTKIGKMVFFTLKGDYTNRPLVSVQDIVIDNSLPIEIRPPTRLFISYMSNNNGVNNFGIAQVTQTAIWLKPNVSFGFWNTRGGPYGFTLVWNIL